MGKYAGSPQKRMRAFSMERPRQEYLANQSMPSTHLQFKGSFYEEKKAVMGNKVNTCSYIAKRGDQMVAMPFYQEAKLQNQTDRAKNYSFVQSEAKQRFQNTSSNYVSMPKKPLVVYDPNAQRSKIQQPETRQYYVNRSVLEFGNRTMQDKKAWVSINRNDFVNQNNTKVTTQHPGIQAFKTQWTHKNLQR